MTVKQAADRLGLTEATVRRYCWNKQIAATHHGRDWWITEDALAAFIAARAEPQPRGKPRRPTPPTGAEGENR